MAEDSNLLALTTQIVSAHISHNSVPVDELPALIQRVYATLGSATAPAPPAAEPAVPLKQSVRADRIICLEDGKSFSMLKRHLMTDHKMTPQQYREKWKLPHDYPMTAPDYAKVRSGLAKKIGLGRKSGSAPALASRAKAKTQARKGPGRPRKSA